MAATLALWQKLDKQNTGLGPKWRWQMCQMRATYDAYTRERLRHEEALEADAIRELDKAPKSGAIPAMDAALAALEMAEKSPVRGDLRRRIDELAEALFRVDLVFRRACRSITPAGPAPRLHPRLRRSPAQQSMVAGRPVRSIRLLEDEPARLWQLLDARTWENPGPGSFYDQVGHVGGRPTSSRGTSTPLAGTAALIPEVLCGTTARADGNRPGCWS
ncbi:MAG: hypothetical protein U0800_12095 [Isosphaeraceae bacterium]